MGVNCNQAFWAATLKNEESQCQNMKPHSFSNYVLKHKSRDYGRQLLLFGGQLCNIAGAVILLKEYFQ